MSRNNSVCAVIVLYRQRYFESKSYRSLLLVADWNKDIQLDVVLYDNSNNAQTISSDNPFNSLIYYHDPRNIGVIPAYNYALAYCESHSIKWLLRLDQDSIFDEKLFRSFFDSVDSSDGKALCYVPKIISSGELISPSIIKKGGFWGKLPQDFYGIPSQKLTFINSMSFVDAGSIIVNRLLRDSHFMLDLSDHELAYRINVNDVYVLDIIVEHSLSVMESNYVSKDRYIKILESEIHFSKLYYTFIDKVVFKLRLFLRCIKHLLMGRIEISYYTIKGLFR